MGDRTTINGDVTNAAVGTGASVNARDIMSFKHAVDQCSGLDDALRQKLNEARELLDELDCPQQDKNDAADDLGKLTDELDKESPAPSRIVRYWNRLQEIVPTVAAVLKSVESVKKLLGT